MQRTGDVTDLRRYGKTHVDRARAKIQASAIVGRLNAFALGQTDPNSGKPVEMTQAQVRAAAVLLAKVLPDLSAADINHNVTVSFDATAIASKLRTLLGDSQAGELLRRLGYAQQAIEHVQMEEGATSPVHSLIPKTNEQID